MASSRTARKRPSAPPTPRKQPQQKRASETVDAIITAVERVLDTHGAAGLTTNRIAEVAGVSVGTLYQYFPNKQALVGALQERVLQLLLDALRIDFAAGATEPLPVLAARLATSMVRIYQGQRPIHAWLIELRTEAAYQERFRHAINTYADETATFLATRPEVGPDRARATAFVVVHAIEGVVNGFVARPGAHDLATLVPEIVRMALSYVSRQG